MAELNLKQITDKLNSEFSGEVRKLVFWYDEGAEFVDDVDTLDLVNAKVLHLEPDNQFYTKYFLECVDTTTNYLVYAPFAKPTIRENHLADTIKYSKEFFADRASLLTIDLGIDERYKPVIQHYIKFFGEKKRTQAFYDLELETFNRNTIEIALMSVLCKCKTPSYEEVLRTVLTDAGFEDNPYLAEFKKYDLLDAFWRQAQDVFGYADEKPTLEKFTMTMFVTYAAKVIPADMPAAWKPFISFKSGNVIAFIDNLMNSYIYGERFDVISKMIYVSLKAEVEFRKLPAEALVSCGIFAGIDELLIEWVTERLELEDVAAKLGDTTIPQLTKQRRQGHFGKRYAYEYFVLQNAWNIISGSQYAPSASLNEMVKNYTSELYKMDRYYRYFYYYLDKLEDATRFDKLKELVENIYSNEYLAKVCTNWNDLFSTELESLQIMKQPDFFSRNVNYSKDQLVVIISDALRYEVGMTLLEKLQADEKCTATMKTMASTLPSITQCGMAALLPHRSLELTEDYSVLVDGQKTDTLEQRQAILQKYKPASRCVQYDDIKNLSVADLRSIFTRQDVVYIYHNQIDARGDKLNTENEVFNACAEAVDEISALIRRLTTSANRSRFIVTADHGFLYRRNKLAESDKIGSISGAADVLGRRYLLSAEAVATEGVTATAIGTMMQNKDERMVSYPVGADIFKAPGSGMNYVHGGCSPQEMLVPLIEVKTEKRYKETTTAQIALVSLTSKITNLITSLDFVQTDAVSDVVKETTYRIYFVDGNGEKISNEHLYVADKKDTTTVKRVFRLRFSFKNKKYSKDQKYYLVAYDANNALEALRHEIIMDIAFADDFDFGF
ncbi:BREX-1 system phosphatase PglZ type A [Butyricicoccus porcorum]|uniref:TIGR02687 family protein n=1 Tax=Butyricicoccus porcorum TaxID=1945634 RepID=A0A252F1J2_9FIRM|nr:BREX-1 system phosphatase PglZ type A [Butyricicoccus porcorum]OUM19541.1 TIGR02687 family protein [Butyricicoccus porcorum]